MIEPQLSTPDKEKIVEAKKQGVPRKQVAELFKCDEGTVSRVVAKSRTTGNVHRAPGSGRLPATTPR